MQAAISSLFRFFDLVKDETVDKRILPCSGSRGCGMVASNDTDSIRVRAAIAEGFEEKH